MTIPLWPNVFTGNVSKITAAFGNYVRTSLPKAVDGVDGGNFAPANPLVINGLTIADAGGDVDVAGDLDVGGDGAVGGDIAIIGGVSYGGATHITGVTSPSALAATVDDWIIPSVAGATIVRVTCDAGGTALSGMTTSGTSAPPEDGRFLHLLVVGGGPLTLNDEDGGSTAGFRFAIAAPVVIEPGHSAPCWYDGDVGRWRILSVS